MLFSFRLKATRHEKADTKFNTSSWHRLGCASRNCRNYRTRTRFDRHHQHTKCFPLPGASIPSEAMMHSPLLQNSPLFPKKNVRLRAKFSQFDPTYFSIFVRQTISDDFFSYLLEILNSLYFRCFSTFSPIKKM